MSSRKLIESGIPILNGKRSSETTARIKRCGRFFIWNIRQNYGARTIGSKTLTLTDALARVSVSF